MVVLFYTTRSFKISIVTFQSMYSKSERKHKILYRLYPLSYILLVTLCDHVFGWTNYVILQVRASQRPLQKVKQQRCSTAKPQIHYSEEKNYIPEVNLAF